MEPPAAGGDPHPSPSGGASPPYPPPPPPPPPPTGWLAGLVSGAGRLLASVLGPDDSSPSRSGSAASGGYASPSPSPSSHRRPRARGESHYGGTDHDDSMRFPSKNNQLNQSEGYTQASLAIISDIEPKDAIMQLLMQETYSRSECTTLIKIIQERVVDPESGGVVDGDIRLPISWKADIQQTVGYSPIHRHGFDNNAAAEAVPTITPASRGLFNHNADNIPSTSKRSYSVVRDTPEDLRRVRSKIDGNPINIPKFKQVDVVRNCPGDANKLLSDVPCLGANSLAHFNVVLKFERSDDIFDVPNKIPAVPSHHFDSNSLLAGGEQKKSEPTFFKSCPNKGLKNGFPLKVEPLDDLIPFERKMVDLSHQKHKDAACDDSGSVSKLMFMEDIAATPSLQMGLPLQNGLKNRRRKQSNSPRTTPKISESPAMGTRSKISDATVKAEIDLLEQTTPVSNDKQDPDYVPGKRPVGRLRKGK